MTTSTADTNISGDGNVTRQQWKWTVLASMASYIDAGSIVAGAIGLALWAQYLHMGPAIVGLLGAFSSNAISTAIGSLIGGRLGDLFGRKRIYTVDLLVYAFGVLWIIFAVQIWMLFVGYILVGLAVGADVPTSWALVGEFSPNRARGKLLGLTQIFW
ncbi:MAG: MFS transporter, partial [Chloroflexi bacterium]|nr:MFS transporter [Chloroflexota bacterium]